MHAPRWCRAVARPDLSPLLPFAAMPALPETGDERGLLLLLSDDALHAPGIDAGCRRESQIPLGTAGRLPLCYAAHPHKTQKFTTRPKPSVAGEPPAKSAP